MKTPEIVILTLIAVLALVFSFATGVKVALDVYRKGTFHTLDCVDKGNALSWCAEKFLDYKPTP